MEVPWTLLGFNLSGDIGPYSIYTDAKRRKIVYPKSPPDKPPSTLQLHQRNRFTQAQSAWKALPDQVKRDLEEVCRRSSLVMGGCALWISASLKPDGNESIQTLARQTGIPLPTCVYINN